MGKTHRLSVAKYFLTVALTCNLMVPVYAADRKDDADNQKIIHLGSSRSIVYIDHPVADFDPTKPLEPQTLNRSKSYTYPTIPLAGFTPYVAISASNTGSYTGGGTEPNMEHQMRSGYYGTPLRTQAGFPNGPFVVGILDTGADADLITGASATMLGISGTKLTGNNMDLGGAGDEVLTAKVSQPLGYFATGLAGVKANNTLDPNYTFGHTNASVLATDDAINCGGQETDICVIGRPALTFTTTVIHNDIRRTINYQGETITGPDIRFYPTYSELANEYPHRISMLLNGAIPVKTANWYYDIYSIMNILDMDYSPAYPTTLAGEANTLPTNAIIIINVEISHGDEVESLKMMLDTGAQSSILTTHSADALSLPLEGDFTAGVCGIGGTVEVSGYYLDKVKISAGGGALKFSHAPFIVMDIAGDFDGVLGMNFFYDRNIVLSPNLSKKSYKLYVSDPIDFADTVLTDLNSDNKVDLTDFSFFAQSWLTNYGDPAYNPACDLFLSDSVDMTDFEIFVQNWLE